jgi:F-type H+-transporting ATPase subunit gamma
MERLARLNARIATVQELGRIIHAMRSLAAMRVQQAQSALPGIREYATVAGNAILGVQPFGSNGGAVWWPHDSRARVLIGFCAEHGFVGDFNDVLLERIAARLADGPTLLFLVGDRGVQIAAERGLDVYWSHPMATQAGGVLGIARRLAPALYRAVRAGPRVVDIVFGRYRAGGDREVQELRLLPPDFSAFAAPATLPPLHNLPADVLMEKLVEEYVLAELTRVAMESLASENGARLRAMDQACDNVEDLRQKLKRSADARRQEEITTELLDVVTGTMAQLGRAL